MSDWHGPSTYVIASAHNAACRVALDNGKKADGTKVWALYVPKLQPHPLDETVATA